MKFILLPWKFTSCGDLSTDDLVHNIRLAGSAKSCQKETVQIDINGLKI